MYDRTRRLYPCGVGGGILDERWRMPLDLRAVSPRSRPVRFLLGWVLRRCPVPDSHVGADGMHGSFYDLPKCFYRSTRKLHASLSAQWILIIENNSCNAIRTGE